jgi:hypothetical protein
MGRQSVWVLAWVGVLKHCAMRGIGRFRHDQMASIYFVYSIYARINVTNRPHQMTRKVLVFLVVIRD